MCLLSVRCVLCCVRVLCVVGATRAECMSEYCAGGTDRHQSPSIRRVEPFRSNRRNTLSVRPLPLHPPARHIKHIVCAVRAASSNVVSVCLFDCLSLFVCLSVFLSFCLSIFLSFCLLSVVSPIHRSPIYQSLSLAHTHSHTHTHTHANAHTHTHTTGGC